MEGLVLKNISKQFKDNDHVTLKNINLEVGNDEFLILLGPSGCGKTTLLRIISGLLRPTSGQILLGGEDVTELEPQERGIGMVFQNYALYPHMNVRKNLTFALDVARIKKDEQKKRVNWVSEMLGIGKHLSKKPHQMSGGERQRVAMGRAMATNSRIYLFDEPLSNLDENLRTRLRPEILSLFHQLHVPFVYVTHDQVDAMTMGTKIAVMNQGEILQLGTPMEIYDQPQALFVAKFVGTPMINTIAAEVVETEGRILLKSGAFSLELPRYADKLEQYIGKTVIVAIRPEDILTTKVGDEYQHIECRLERYEHLGNKVQLYLDFNGNELRVSAPTSIRAKVGQNVTLYMDKNKVHLFDAESEKRI